jgi:hypothetical protein
MEALAGLVKHKLHLLTLPPLRILIICIINKFLGKADEGTTLWEALVQRKIF